MAVPLLSLYLLKLTKIKPGKDMAKLTDRNIFLADAYPSTNAVILNDNGVLIFSWLPNHTGFKKIFKKKITGIKYKMKPCFLVL